MLNEFDIQKNEVECEIENSIVKHTPTKAKFSHTTKLHACGEHSTSLNLSLMAVIVHVLINDFY